METEAPKTRTCAFEGCKKDFEPTKRTQKYCSDNCRSNAHKVRTLDRFGLSEPKTEIQNRQSSIAGLGQLGPQYEYIVNDLTRQRDKAEADLKETRASKKALREKYEALQKEYDKYKNEIQLDQIREESEGGGLEGFLETPTGQKVLEMFGPTIVKVVEALPIPGLKGPAQPGQSAQAPTPNEELTEEQRQAAEIFNTIAQMPVSVQGDVLELVAGLAHMSESRQMFTLQQLKTYVGNSQQEAYGS